MPVTTVPAASKSGSQGVESSAKHACGCWGSVIQLLLPIVAWLQPLPVQLMLLLLATVNCCLGKEALQ